MIDEPGHYRTHLRVPLSTEAWIAWGYQRSRCQITEFSTHGLTVRGIMLEVGTPVSIQLSLEGGPFTLCGSVVHGEGLDGAVGIRFFRLPLQLQTDLEIFLWTLLASPSAPSSLKQCAVQGCDRPHKARGFCSLHYNRWRRQQG
jgi:hypothetical protein